MTLSFLDALCCGLGGTVILFIIFVVLEHKGAENPQTSQGESSVEQMIFTRERTDKASPAPIIYSISMRRRAGGGGALKLTATNPPHWCKLLTNKSGSGDANYLLYIENPGSHGKQGVQLTAEPTKAGREVTILPVAGGLSSSEISVIYLKPGEMHQIICRGGKFEEMN